MNYYKIVIDGYTEKHVQQTPYVSYFKREAQIAKRDSFVEFIDFFNGCKLVLGRYKNEIEREYSKVLFEYGSVLDSIYCGKGIKYDGVLVTDQNDERIKNTEKRIIDKMMFIKDRGYITNSDYVCCVTETGDVASVYNMKYSLYYSDIYELNEAIIQAERELEPKKQPKSKIKQKHQQFHFTRQFADTEQKHLFEGLINGGFLPQKTNYIHFCYVFGCTAIPDNDKPFKPLVWLQTIGLLAYCIDNLFSDTDKNNLWKITANCFLCHSGIPNKNTMKNTISKIKQDSKNKPKGYEKIDTIVAL
ncbi:MAG: hypothetical protein LBQ28_10985 [Prevotellaceae bacterium]|jgi:hypothetical protein|nr:hypothetical protein [Prevotellaceae bacterium]